MALPLPLRVLEGHLRSYRHTWRGTSISAVVTPVLFLAAMGLGLGSLVDAGRSPEALGGVAYLAWLAPGLLAGGAMMNGAGDGSFPVMGGIRWMRTYHAALASPVRPRDLVFGNLLWAGLRATAAATSFVVVAALFGAMPLSRGVLAMWPAILTGVATCAVVSAFTATRNSDQSLASMFRYVVMPLFLFSGTVFPIDQLPALVQPIRFVVPLWHGVEVARALALRTSTELDWALHLGVLALVLLVGVVWAIRNFARRLTP